MKCHSPVVFLVVLVVSCFSPPAFALSSPNIPLDSPIYLYLEKLSGFGLVTGDFKGVRPFTRSEAARLLSEAEEKLDAGGYPDFAREVAVRLKELLPRETSLREHPAAAPAFDFNPVSNARLRYVYLDGAPRSYVRPVHDEGGDWIFPLPQNRVDFPPDRIFQQNGTEGTPLMENNEGTVYTPGATLEGRFQAEMYSYDWLCAVAEPIFLLSDDESTVRLNKGYLKVGGGPLEVEVGQDANWLGLGYRGAVTLTNNAENFVLVKVSSPEPVDLSWFWDFKYDVIISRFDRTVTGTVDRQPYFYALKLSMKPTKNLEWGVNLGRQVGGPGTGLDNGFNATVRGLVGATNSDNSNTLAGAELRLRLPQLWNTEFYGEFNGEDRSDFWPQATSYVAGLFIPRIGREGRDDLRFEYFRGHEILYANGTFPAGYLYHGLPVGHSQGGATEDFFLRYSHWFSVRNVLALEGIYTSRGEEGRVAVNAAGNYDPAGTMQALEKKYAVRAQWRLPVYGDWDADIRYGWEKIKNVNLLPGEDRINQVLKVDLSYRY